MYLHNDERRRKSAAPDRDSRETRVPCHRINSRELAGLALTGRDTPRPCRLHTCSCCVLAPRGRRQIFHVHKPNTAGKVCSSNPLSLHSWSARVYACFTLSMLQPLVARRELPSDVCSSNSDLLRNVGSSILGRSSKPRARWFSASALAERRAACCTALSQ